MRATLRARKSARRSTADSASDGVDSIDGEPVSPSLASKFQRLGVNTIRDLLYFFPRRHLDYSQKKLVSQLDVGEEQTIVANVWQAQEVSLGGRRSTEAIVGDETGNVRIVFFNNP